MQFSIGIPAFKEKFLRDCINSILSQTISDFELIIVNDASPENLDEIIKDYNDERIRYYKNDKNTGAVNVVDNWNRCLSYAQGQYFILMGDDDLMEKNYLEEFRILINNHPAVNVFHCRSYIINENSQKMEITASWPEFENVYDNIWHRIKSFRKQYISDFVYKTEILKEIGGFYKLPLAWGSDDVTSFIVASINGIAHTNKIIFNYRKNNQTISNSGNPYQKMNAIILVEDWLTKFLKEKPSDTDQLINYHNIKKDYKKYIQKKKIVIISNSIKNKGLSKIYIWLKRMDKYEIKISEIIYAIINNIKDRKLKQIY